MKLSSNRFVAVVFVAIIVYTKLVSSELWAAIYTCMCKFIYVLYNQ